MEHYSVLCGMYSSNTSLRTAWMEWVKLLNKEPPFKNKNLRCQYSNSLKSFDHPNFILGQTCGYPYWTALRESHQPVFTPVFCTQHSNDINYCSLFISRNCHRNEKLSDFYNKTLAYNEKWSHSGYNILRYEIAKQKLPIDFFKKTIETGSHLKSIEAVIQGKADMAAIDCNTFEHAADDRFFDTKEVCILERSSLSTGLPFIIKRDQDKILISDYVKAAKSALKKMSFQNKKVMKVSDFKKVSCSQYQVIGECEKFAIQNGYLKL